MRLRSLFFLGSFYDQKCVAVAVVGLLALNVAVDAVVVVVSGTFLSFASPSVGAMRKAKPTQTSGIIRLLLLCVQMLVDVQRIHTHRHHPFSFWSRHRHYLNTESLSLCNVANAALLNFLCACRGLREENRHLQLQLKEVEVSEEGSRQRSNQIQARLDQLVSENASLRAEMSEMRQTLESEVRARESRQGHITHQ